MEGDRTRSPGVIRVAVADAHTFVRTGITVAFEETDDLEVVASVDSLAALGEPTTVKRGVDVVIADAHLVEGLSGCDMIGRWGAVAPMLVLAHQPTPIGQRAAMTAGAAGYLGKQVLPAEFTAAVRAIAAGRSWPDDIDHGTWIPSQRDTRLSTRETQVLAGLARGLTHTQIAARLHVEQSTVDTYVKRIRTKTGLGNKAELTRYALDHQLSSPQATPVLTMLY